VPDLLASVVTEQAERLSRAIACIEEIAEGEKLIMLQIVERCSDRDLEKAEAAILALLKVIQRVRDERAMEPSRYAFCSFGHGAGVFASKRNAIPIHGCLRKAH
jgi:hypothetical protein